MIAGVNRVWVIDSRLVTVNGYRIGNNRIGLTVASPGFEELIMARGAAGYESQKSGNAWEHKVTIIGYSDLTADMGNAFKRKNKRYLLALYLNSGDMIIVGVDNPLRVSVKNTSGGIPGDISGYTLTFAGLSRNSFDLIDKTIFIPAKIKYGRLYNWFTISDVRGIAPDGWHVPTLAEWRTLSTSLGGGAVAGGILKSKRTYPDNHPRWNSPNVGASNLYNFSAYPGGFRINTAFYQLGGYATLWTSSLCTSVAAYYFAMLSGVTNLYEVDDNLNNGKSIRLLKNDSNNTDSVKDIDGNIYSTIKIGDQVWMAENLIVTKYKTGDLIPEVTDNTAWAALTTGAWCAYDNDPDNI